MINMIENFNDHFKISLILEFKLTDA